MKNSIQNKFTDLKRKPFVTYGILAITLFMYLILSVNGGSENTATLIQYGAKVNEFIYLGEWWRLITPMFLHIGFTHLVLNSLIIYFLGSNLEFLIGHLRFFLLYFFSALLGNTASFALNNAVAAGASTAIFGMFASTIVLAKMYPYHSGIQRLSRDYVALIVINIVFGLLSSSIDNAGHFGGLVGGYLMMYVISSKNALNNPKKKRIISAIGYILLLIILFAFGYFKVQNLYQGFF